MPQLSRIGRLGALGSAPGQGGGGATEPDYFYAAAPQESFYGFKLAGEFATEYNGKTYITFQGPKFDSYCVVYDWATGKKRGPFVIRGSALTADTHGVPAHIFCASGKMLVAGTSVHNTPLLLTRMTNAEDPRHGPI
jgi:hypothetical protein